MNLKKAITLLKTLSASPSFVPEKKQFFRIFERQDDEYMLVEKTELIHEEYRNYVKKIAESHILKIEESSGLMVIYDPGENISRRATCFELLHSSSKTLTRGHCKDEIAETSPTLRGSYFLCPLNIIDKAKTPVISRVSIARERTSGMTGVKVQVTAAKSLSIIPISSRAIELQHTPRKSWIHFLRIAH